jgi:transposase
MPRAYSEDLRVRVIEAVKAGASMRAAGRLFLIAASTAITWVGEWRQSGRTAAKPMGGSRSPLEQHATWLLAQVAHEPSLTLAGLQQRLRDELGVGAAVSALWRFFHRHDISFKKSSAPPSRSAPTLPAHARAGSSGKPRSTRSGWSFSMRPVRAPTWYPCAVVAAAASV